MASMMILGLSIILQLVAAVLALRLIRITRRRLAWTLVAVALLLITARRGIQLTSHVVGHDPIVPSDLYESLLALVISALFIWGVYAIAPLFTEMIQAKETLKEREGQLQIIIASMADGLLIADVETKRLRFANPAICRMLGYSKEELLGMSVEDLHPPDEAPVATEAFARLMAGESVVQTRDRCLRKDKAVLCVGVGVARIDYGGRPCLVGIFRDMTEHDRTEGALRESERKYRLLFEQGIDGIVVSVYGRIVDCNQSFARMHGTTPERLMGQSLSDLPSLAERARVAARIQQLCRGEISETEDEVQYIRGDGAPGWADVRAKAITWEGKPAVQAIVRDITEQKQFQERLVQAQKMEMAGQMAGALAHDFNNLLTGILGHASLLEPVVESNDGARESVAAIEQASRRAADLVSRLLGFVRKGVREHVAVDLKDAVNQVTKLLGPTVEGRIRLSWKFEIERPVVMGDPDQLGQVLMNLAANARDAMPEGGEMTFSIRRLSRNRPEGDSRPETYLVVSVSDTGCGIAEDLRSRIFEPFFTTKAPGRGAGLGLATVYGIVKNHGGWVEVESQVGRGSTFHVYLPEAKEEAVAEALPGVPQQGRGRILLVDDDEMVRRVAERILLSAGFEVFTAPGGREAVAHYREFGPRIDLVVLDMNMPVMDGRACLGALREMNPGVRVLLATGYGDDPATQELINHGTVGLVRKPYDVVTLTEAVCQAMGT